MKKFFNIIFKPIIDLEEENITFKGSGIIIGLLLTILFFIFLTIFSIPESMPITVPLIISDIKNTIPLEIISIILGFIFALLFVATFYGLFAKTNESEKNSFTKLTKNNVLFTLLTTFAVMLILHGSLIPLSSLLPTNPMVEENFEIISKFPLYCIFTTCILAPLKEEYFFRGILMNKLQKKYNPWVGIIVSSLFFGLIHMNFQQFSVAMPLGILFGYIYLETKSIYLCMFGHFLNNAFTGFLFISTESKILQLSLSALYIIIGIAIFIFCKKKFPTSKNIATPIPEDSSDM